MAFNSEFVQKRFKASTLGIIFLGAILIYLIVPPFIFLTHVSFTSGDLFGVGEGFTLKHYRTVFGSASTFELVANSLIFAMKFFGGPFAGWDAGLDCRTDQYAFSEAGLPGGVFTLCDAGYPAGDWMDSSDGSQGRIY